MKRNYMNKIIKSQRRINFSEIFFLNCKSMKDAIIPRPPNNQKYQYFQVQILQTYIRHYSI